MKLLIADESAGTLMRFEQAIVLKLAVGTNYGVGIDFEVHCELANGRQLIPGREIAGGNRSADLVYDLAVHGNAAVHVEVEAEDGSGTRTHVY